MKDLVQAGAQHILIVAIEEQRIAAFMELGTMPSPIPIVTTATNATATTTTWEGVVVEPTTSTSRPEMPFLANLAVGKDYRRQKMGSKLVQLALKISAKWCKNDESNTNTAFDKKDAAMYLAVEKDNLPAVTLYDGLEFRRIIDETENLSQKKRKRKPRLYFEKKLFEDTPT
jgi:ribosomal protein S18 acetylase RimI-like enzyme